MRRNVWQLYTVTRTVIHVVFAHDTFLFFQHYVRWRRWRRWRKKDTACRLKSLRLFSHSDIFMYAICEVSLQGRISHRYIANVQRDTSSILVFTVHLQLHIFVMHIRVICRSRCKSAHGSHYFYSVHRIRCLKSVSKYILADTMPRFWR